MLTMYDSVTASDIPTNAKMVGGYGWEWQNRFRWSPSDWTRFPRAILLNTVISASTNAGDELDIETGDATPIQAPAWVRLRLNAGRKVVSLYMNASTWPEVKAQIDGAGLGRFVVYRVAWYKGFPFTLPGTWGVQYADPNTSGGHYDLSLITDISWLVPPVTTIPPMKRRKAMPYVANGSAAEFMVWDDGSKTWFSKTDDVKNALSGLGQSVPIPVSDNFLSRLKNTDADSGRPELVPNSAK